MVCPCVCEHLNYPLLNARQCHQESELASFYMQRNHPVRVSRDSFFDSRYILSTIRWTVRSLFASHKCYLWLTQVKIRNLLEDVWSSLLKGEEPVGLWRSRGHNQRAISSWCCCQDGSTPAVFHPWVVGSEFRFHGARVWLAKLESYAHIKQTWHAKKRERKERKEKVLVFLFYLSAL